MPGLSALSVGALCLLPPVVQKILPPHVRVHRNPFLAISFLFSGFGMQCIMMGLLAELLMRTYHESQGKPIYTVKTTFPFPLPRTEQSENLEAANRDEMADSVDVKRAIPETDPVH
jgi:hypothetical protein